LIQKRKKEERREEIQGKGFKKKKKEIKNYYEKETLFKNGY